MEQTKCYAEVSVKNRLPTQSGFYLVHFGGFDTEGMTLHDDWLAFDHETKKFVGMFSDRVVSWFEGRDKAIICTVEDLKQFHNEGHAMGIGSEILKEALGAEEVKKISDQVFRDLLAIKLNDFSLRFGGIS